MQIDYEIDGEDRWKLIKTDSNHWIQNLESMQTWSPYSSEEELIDQVFVSPSCELITCI